MRFRIVCVNKSIGGQRRVQNRLISSLVSFCLRCSLPRIIVSNRTCFINYMIGFWAALFERLLRRREEMSSLPYVLRMIVFIWRWTNRYEPVVRTCEWMISIGSQQYNITVWVFWWSHWFNRISIDFRSLFSWEWFLLIGQSRRLADRTGMRESSDSKFESGVSIEN